MNGSFPIQNENMALHGCKTETSWWCTGLKTCYFPTLNSAFRDFIQLSMTVLKEIYGPSQKHFTKASILLRVYSRVSQDKT